jgi:organic hydroperoxide reductase OsmC/OhrA
MATTAKTFSYGVSLDPDGDARSDDGGPVLEHDEAWSPEHLVLTGLARCTLTSLRYHAERLDVTVGGSADATGTVTQRETDGRYAFVRIKVDLDVTLEPAPPNVRELLSKAERDCFVGSSLTAKPRYRWRVNGSERTPAGRVEA